MTPEEIIYLKPNTSFTVDIENLDNGQRIAKVTLKQEGIVAISPELLRNADPNLLLNMGDGTYRIGGLKLSLIMPRPLWASMNNSEMFYVTVIDPNWRNYDGSPYLLEPE